MWYTANLLFKSVHSPTSSKDALWEESIRLIEAETREQAMEKANILGKAAEVSYPIQSDDSTKWTFVKVERVVEIDGQKLKDGAEVFSRFLRESEVQSLLTPFDDE